MRSHFKHKSRAHGFSLIELMVAIGIGLFLSAVVGGVFINARSTFTYQDAMSRLQENARFAMESMTRDIRGAGFTACGNLSGAAGTSLTNTVNGGTGSIWTNLSTPVQGFESPVSQTLFPSATNDSDAIVLLGVSSGCGSGGEMTVSSHVAASATIHLGTQPHSCQPGTIMMVTDCSHTSVFQMSGPTNNNNNAQTIVHNTGTGTPGNCMKELKGTCAGPSSYTYGPGSMVFTLSSNAYYVAPSATANSGNSLWTCSLANQINGNVACSELINGVDKMQVEYGVDTDGDANLSVNGYVTATNVTDWTKVSSARISLLMATPPSAGNLSSKAQTYSFNGSTVTATDRQVRHPFSSVVTIRNRTK